MDKLSFKAFTKLCQLNLDKKYVQELFKIITNSDCVFHPGIVMPQNHIASLYKLRLEIAKDSGKLGEDYINDFDRTVSNSQNSKSKELGLTWLQTEHNSYLVFYEPSPPNIFGVLKVVSSSSLQSFGDNNVPMGSSLG